MNVGVMQDDSSAPEWPEYRNSYIFLSDEVQKPRSPSRGRRGRSRDKSPYLGGVLEEARQVEDRRSILLQRIGNNEKAEIKKKGTVVVRTT